MWELRSRNRGIFVLISLLSGCAILYNAWGPILALTVSIILVIYVCYSLLTNDSILSPQTFVLIKYLKEASQELTTHLNTAWFYISSTSRKLYTILNNNYRTHVASKMNRFRQNTYQLSNDTHDSSRNSSRFDLITNPLSPISKNDYQENISYNHQTPNHYSTNKLTSTPLAPLRKHANTLSNGAISPSTPSRPHRPETLHGYGPNHISMRSAETLFSPEGSPWGTSISPKIRSKAGGVKTVQTIAGPLLASTRYNIDPKVYSDVTSPGLSTRLAKYATEANNKLTHQSQYGTGQFPKVNLSASPLPLISVKHAKIRTPVTVRIAPPEASRYSPPEMQKLISDVCRAESRAAAPPSVVQVLREISLKRHASREDLSSDLVKKQRTEDLFDEHVESLEDTKQKRTREDSPNTEEEILARHQLRPVKKTKTPSCYDVLNSLSSSNQYSVGIKRKASTLDLSRSGTPDVEKHFKASETVQTSPKITMNLNEPQEEIRKPQKHDLNEKSSPSVVIEEDKKLQEKPVVRMKGILKGQTGKSTVIEQQQSPLFERCTKIEEEKEYSGTKNSSLVGNKLINFTDKLFMKAEPQTNERLRTLIQEQGNIRAKFTTDDVDEIKKEDIVNMRQTSMRARLQSMFDAISGKPTKKINPDIIIHAEGTNEPTTATETMPADLVTLNSTTSTTNVNTSPIVTSAVAPTVADSKLSTTTTTTKHVTFNLPTSQSSETSQSSSTEKVSPTGTKTNTTETGNLNLGAPKLSFGTLLSNTTTSKSVSVPNSMTLSFSNYQNANATNAAAPSSDDTKIAPPSFNVSSSSAQNAMPSFGTPSTNVTSATNNSLNSVTATVTAAKSLSPSSTVAFTSSNYTSITQNSNVVSLAQPSTTLGTTTTTSSVFSSGMFTSETTKSIEPVKTSAQPSVPMPNFSFGVPKTSTVTAIFDGNTQTASTNMQNQSSTTNVSIVPAKIQQSTFNVTATIGGTMGTANTVVNTTTSSVFAFDSSTSTPQSTNAGSFLFTSNANAGKGPGLTFGNTSSHSTPVFEGAVSQNPPSFGSTITFQGVQSSGNVTATTTHNTPIFGSSLTSNQNPPAFGSAVTSAQTTPMFGTVASSASPLSFGSTSTNSTFTFGNTATTSTISAFGTNTNSSTPSIATTSGTNPVFTFGSSTTSITKSGFVFGANTSTTPSANTGIGATGSSNQIAVFGASAGSNTAPLFGIPSTTTPPAFGATSTTVVPVYSAPTSTAIPVFGGTSTTAPPPFTTQTSETAFSYAAGNRGSNALFSVTNLAPATNTTVPVTASSAFGGNSVSKSGFGQTKLPPSFAASTSGAFGTGGTPSFRNQGSTFGANNTSTLAGSSSGFGNQTATTPNFGTQNSAVKQTPKVLPPAFGSTSSVFGSTTTAPPAFGANTVTSAGFGSSAATFGTQNTNAPPSFGASTGNTVPAIGANASTPFGGQGQSSTPSFGAQSSPAQSFGTTNNNTSAAFGFGGNQNSGFSFTGTAGATNNSTTTTTPFQFGGTAAKSEGFNFNASTTSPNINFGTTATPSFGASSQGGNMFGTPSPAVPAGGMFNIGAGSTAPRSRSSRTRRR